MYIILKIVTFKNTLHLKRFIFLTIISFCCFFTKESFGNNYNNSYLKKTQTESEKQFNEFDEFEDFNFDIKSSNSTYDPFEYVNRKIFIFNNTIDHYLLEPIAIKYKEYVPFLIKKSIKNFFNNISSLESIVNSILQADLNNTAYSTSSFLINSTVGILGLIDVAKKNNINFNEEDFGQTLAKYGVSSGPYLIIPLFGPLNLRDFSAKILTMAADPLSINVFEIGRDDLVIRNINNKIKVLELISIRESLLKIISDSKRNSLDFYATSRSAYTQNRNAKINNK